MLENTADSFESLPLFQETQREFQQGNWDSGLAHLQELEEARALQSAPCRQESAAHYRWREILVGRLRAAGSRHGDRGYQRQKIHS